MLIPTIIMGGLAIMFLVVGYIKGQHINGLKRSSEMILEILPMLFFAFIVAGMIQVLLPQELISKWVGAESGIRGILIGTLGGMLTPGGPYVTFPLVAGLMLAGTSIGPAIAFITAWSLMSLSRLPMEVSILGWKFVLVRLSCTFLVAPLAGLIAQLFYGNAKN